MNSPEHITEYPVNESDIRQHLIGIQVIESMLPQCERKREGEAFSLQDLWVLLIEQEDEFESFPEDNEVVNETRRNLDTNIRSVIIHQASIMSKALEGTSENENLRQYVYGRIDNSKSPLEQSQQKDELILEYARKDLLIREMLAVPDFSAKLGETVRPVGREIDSYHANLKSKFDEYIERLSVMSSISSLCGNSDLQPILEEIKSSDKRLQEFDSLPTDVQTLVYLEAHRLFEERRAEQRRQLAEQHGDHVYSAEERIANDNYADSLRVAEANEQKAIDVAARARKQETDTAQSILRSALSTAEKSRQKVVEDERLAENRKIASFREQEPHITRWVDYDSQGIAFKEAYYVGKKDDVFTLQAFLRTACAVPEYRAWRKRTADSIEEQLASNRRQDQHAQASREADRIRLPRIRHRTSQAIDTKTGNSDLDGSDESLDFKEQAHTFCHRYACAVLAINIVEEVKEVWEHQRSLPYSRTPPLTTESLVEYLKTRGATDLGTGVLAKETNSRSATPNEYYRLLVDGVTKDKLFTSYLKRYLGKDKERESLLKFTRNRERVDHYNNLSNDTELHQIWLTEHKLDGVHIALKKGV
jgi:hypothetical protein